MGGRAWNGTINEKKRNNDFQLIRGFGAGEVELVGHNPVLELTSVTGYYLTNRLKV